MPKLVPTPREELLWLQRRLAKRNKQLIEDTVLHEDRSFKAYEKRYLKAVKNYEALSSPEEMLAAVTEADLIYVGDYHTLNQSQRSLLRLLRLLVEETTDFILAFEVVQGRHQKALDAYLAEKIQEEHFLKKIQFREHWFFDLWQNFKPLFDFAKYHGLAIVGIESDRRRGLSLAQRDKEMAVRIVKVLKKNPGKKIIVFVGDLHLAPSHLPLQVDRLLKKSRLTPQTLTLYQNSESIYWKLAEAELEEQTSVVKMGPGAFCRMHTPPIIAQQSYLNWLEHEGEALDYADAKQTFLGYLEQIASFLGIDLGVQAEGLEVFTCGDLSFLKKLKESGLFNARELRKIKKLILEAESYYIPKIKVVYLANVSVNHATEEAGHALRHFCAGEEAPRPVQDAFYASVIYQALGFLSSKIINHKRKSLKVTDFSRLLAYLQSSEHFQGRMMDYHVARLFLEHESLAKKRLLFSSQKIATFSPKLFLALSQALGYTMGDKLFYALFQEKVSKATIKDLFESPFAEEGEPQKVVLSILEKIRTVKIPERG